jgi:hypothetical protein
VVAVSLGLIVREYYRVREGRSDFVSNSTLPFFYATIFDEKYREQYLFINFL